MNNFFQYLSLLRKNRGIVLWTYQLWEILKTGC